MDISIFTDKSITPTNENLASVLGKDYNSWNKIKTMVYELYPRAVEEWNHPGKKYGWSFRMKDKKRAIIYLLPRDKYFMVAMIFGNKATDQIMNSDISDDIKTALMNARVYAEGRGFRLVFNKEISISDIRKLVEIKLAN